MEKTILFRAMIEVVGAPQDYVAKSIKDYLGSLRLDKKYEVLTSDIAAVEKQSKQELWGTFAELEVKTDKIDNLLNFCFDYMPSVIEIIEPEEIKISERDLSNFLSDLQAKLHSVDVIAKQVKLENDSLKKSIAALLRNYITVLLSRGSLSSKQLNEFTGVPVTELEEFLDQLIDAKEIDLKDGVYFINKDKIKSPH